MFRLLSLMLLTAAYSAFLRAEVESFPEGRHRLDLSVTALDASEANVYTVFPAYTYTLGGQFRLGITSSYHFLSYDDEGFEDILNIDDSGFGDTDIALQFTPSETLTSNPWVPDTLGLTFGLTAPTGEDDYSGHLWSFRIGFGWAYPLSEHLFLIPIIEYEDTFSEEDDIIGYETYGVALGIQWVSTNGFWVGYTPYMERDTFFKEWADDHSFVIGKMWPSGFGIGLEYAQRSRIDKTAKRDDYTALLNFYYQFGRPL